MDRLARITRRLKSLTEFQEVVRALQAMAATATRTAEAALGPARAHLDVVQAAAAAAFPSAEATSRHHPAEGRGPAALLVLGSEHGFVGALNDRLASRAATDREPHEAVAAIGQRAALALEEAGLPPVHRFEIPPNIKAVPRVAGMVTGELAWARRLRVLHPRLGKGHRVEIRLTEVLPALPFAPDRRPGTSHPLDRPLRQLDDAALAAGLAAEIVFARVAEALIETIAAENMSRLLTLQRTDRNLRDRLDALRQEERTLRQEAITEELIEIAAGAEAVLAAETEEPSGDGAGAGVR
ncbi:MAG: hypothetical protein D6688_01765 [Alphaproteobacteria bacterium]|nr:MAG: hypothetical protein D6688_01765 [Alphaproteobacteria bacterium]